MCVTIRFPQLRQSNANWVLLALCINMCVRVCLFLSNCIYLLKYSIKPRNNIDIFAAKLIYKWELDGMSVIHGFDPIKLPSRIGCGQKFSFHTVSIQIWGNEPELSMRLSVCVSRLYWTVGICQWVGEKVHRRPVQRLDCGSNLRIYIGVLVNPGDWCIYKC